MPQRSGQLVLLATRTTPSSRGACAGGPRPCPHVACRKHLWAVDDRPGRRWTDTQRQWTRVVQHTPSTCALDEAVNDKRDDAEPEGTDDAHMSFAAIGERMGVSGERVRQVYEVAVAKLKRLRSFKVLHLQVDNCRDCPCHTPQGGCEYPGEPPRDTPEIGIPDWCPMRTHPLLMDITVVGGRKVEATSAVESWQEVLEQEDRG